MQYGDDGWVGGLLFFNSVGYEMDWCCQRVVSDSLGVEDDVDVLLVVILGIVGVFGLMFVGCFFNILLDMCYECNVV